MLDSFGHGACTTGPGQLDEQKEQVKAFVAAEIQKIQSGGVGKALPSIISLKDL